MTTTTFQKMLKPAVIAAALFSFATGAHAGKGPGKPGDDTIVEIALAVNGQLGEFDYLLGAVGCLTDDTGYNPVVDLLNGNKRHTLFAPTDEAFMNLQRALGVPEDSLAPEVTCTLGNDVVLNVLAYHVTQGRRFANSVFNDNNVKTLNMLNGETVRSNPGFTLTDKADQSVGVVLMPGFFNINASNGVIHVVDTVLIPTL